MSASAKGIVNYKIQGAYRPPKKLSNRVALLLAGGDGVRLQELTSRIAGAPIPKQYCRLLQGSSLLEATISRARLFAPRERISVVINENHLALAKDQVNTLTESNIIVQPLNRDTGPGMVYALLCLERANPDATVAVFPTDHYIDKDWAFIDHAIRAVNTVARLPDKIAILGVVPDRPETGYGYILPAARVRRSDSAYNVEAFTEKPNIENARAIIARGGLWNTLVMVFNLSRMLKLLEEVVPHEFEKLSEVRASPKKTADIYRTLSSWNLSTQVLSRIPQHLIVHRVANVHWCDWGTRELVERTYRTLNLAPFWNFPNSKPHCNI
jgi:mannose-1-phosphate guanylyltransferase